MGISVHWIKVNIQTSMVILALPSTGLGASKAQGALSVQKAQPLPFSRTLFPSYGHGLRRRRRRTPLLLRVLGRNLLWLFLFLC